MGHPGSWWGESLSVLTHALKPIIFPSIYGPTEVVP